MRQVILKSLFILEKYNSISSGWRKINVVADFGEKNLKLQCSTVGINNSNDLLLVLIILGTTSKMTLKKSECLLDGKQVDVGSKNILH